jgi:hypothetical protein
MVKVQPFLHYYRVPATADILVANIEIEQSYANKCIEEAKLLGDSMNRSTSLKGFMTSFYVYEETDVLNPLLDAIHSVCSMYTHMPLEIEEAWVGIYNEGDYAIEHDHYGYALSFCYYLSADNGDAEIEFTEANKKFYPTTGMLLVFPSHAKHKVHEQKSTKERVVLAGNLQFIREKR